MMLQHIPFMHPSLERYKKIWLPCAFSLQTFPYLLSSLLTKNLKVPHKSLYKQEKHQKPMISQKIM